MLLYPYCVFNPLVFKGQSNYFTHNQQQQNMSRIIVMYNVQ